MQTPSRSALMLGLLILWPLASFPAEETTRPDLSGTWRLNADMSENPRDQMRESTRGGRSGGGGGGRGGGMKGGGGVMGGGRGGMGGGMGGGMSRGGEPDAQRERMEEIGLGIDLLTISHINPEIRITYSTDREVVLTADGKKVKTETERGEVTTTTKWKKDKLVVTKRTDRGKVVESYLVGARGQQLYVTVEMSGMGPMGSISLRRVYDPVAGESAEIDDV